MLISGGTDKLVCPCFPLPSLANGATDKRHHGQAQLVRATIIQAFGRNQELFEPWPGSVATETKPLDDTETDLLRTPKALHKNETQLHLQS